MNILVSDSWLREFLTTKATPSQIKEYLSLCGPSVERIHKVGEDIVYEIEVTSNRPDSMSILGIAREATSILPRFGIAAKLTNDPYSKKFKIQNSKFKLTKKLNIKTDSTLNPRWTSVVIDNVKVDPSPAWLKKRLEATGIRSLNTVVDITNYIMRAYGQPVHAFDYDEVKPKNGIPTMLLRASRRGERITTLDGKTHTLPGSDIVIEDGSGRLIDLCGIMGAQNSAIKDTTKTIVLFMQTYSPTHIRQTAMSLSHRTEAATLFEKGLDPELVMPALLKGVELVMKLSGGKPASQIYDFYPHPYQPYSVSVERTKVDAYLGTKLTHKDISAILTPLGLKVTLTDKQITVSVPSYRRDIEIDVDIIEEIARIFGYHKIPSKLPESEAPMITPDKTLVWEEEIKVRLRDWGYTEAYTYSMISEGLMDIFKLDKTKTYKISNPLSSEWVYMRPSLWPSVLSVLKQNLNIRNDLKLFELSMIYKYRRGDLPNEMPVLLVAWIGKKFPVAKGLADALFCLFGIPFIQRGPTSSSLDWYGPIRLELGDFGSVGEVNQEILATMGIQHPVTILELDFAKLASQAQPTKKYVPIPKFPPSYEDLAFVVLPNTYLGPLIETLKKADPLVSEVSLLDSYGDTRTFHITYQSKVKNLTAADVKPIRVKLIKVAESKFGAQLKTI